MDHYETRDHYVPPISQTRRDIRLLVTALTQEVDDRTDTNEIQTAIDRLDELVPTQVEVDEMDFNEELRTFEEEGYDEHLDNFEYEVRQSQAFSLTEEEERGVRARIALWPVELLLSYVTSDVEFDYETTRIGEREWYHGACYQEIRNRLSPVAPTEEQEES